MGAADLLALTPYIAITVTAVAVMLASAFFPSHRLSALLSLIGLIAALALLPVAGSVAPRPVTPLFTVDSYSLFLSGLFFLAGLVVLALAYASLTHRERMAPGRHGEFYVLLLLALLGAGTLTASTHFASFFLGLELLSISLFVLIAYPMEREHALEAGVKYLLLSGISSPFLLFGMALVYGAAGSMQLSGMGAALGQAGQGTDLFLLAGFAMIVVGVGFKLSLVPFHLWTPDVYQGAATPVTAFVATVSKGAVFAVLLRYLGGANLSGGSLGTAVAMVAMASMLAGNLLALYQGDLKRLLAYSSIAHLGYLLLTLLVASALGPEAALFYLVAYFVTMLTAFGAVSALDVSRGADAASVPIESCRGLFWRRPGLGIVLTLALLSLAGMPVTAGFIGKFYLFSAGVGAALWPLLATLVIGSVIGMFYYLRVIAVMFGAPEESKNREGEVGVESWGSAAAITALALVLVAIGLFPSTLIELARQAAAPIIK